MTGSTHGMTFKIRPPRKANNSMVANWPAGTGGALFFAPTGGGLMSSETSTPCAGELSVWATRTPVKWLGHSSPFLVIILLNELDRPSKLIVFVDPSTEKLVL